MPLPGPQTEALRSKADVLFYGGSAGGGKTDLLLGAASTKHRKSIIFRREHVQLQGIKDRATELFLPLGGRYNGQDSIWRLPGRRVIELGAVQRPGDEQKYQGRPHDLKGFDEICHFLESQFRYLGGWLRSANAKQQCRVICTGNPPTTAEGDWVISYWGPWLDDQHPHPAKPGELRWFTTLEGKDRECENGDPILFQGEEIFPKSRTFIPSSVDDNPYYLATGYKAVLQSLPEPLRSKMLKGDFSVGQEDNPWQIIPTAWVKAAQERWSTRKKPSTPQSAIGVDVARGGSNQTILTVRYGNWFDEQKVYPGKETPDGPSVVQLIISAKRGNPVINTDVIGVGASVCDIGKQQGLRMVPLNGSEGTEARDRSEQLGFVNQRAEYWWKMREDLDPENGEELALPPDRELMADLCAPRWTLKARGIQVESKDDIIKRLGRSPDKGDSAVYANAIRFVPGMGMLEFMKRQAEEKHEAKCEVH